MRKLMCVAALAGLAVFFTPCGAQAAGQTPKPAVTEGNKAQVNERAQERYEDYLEREKAKDATELQGIRAKIEDKYKGYVRPKRDKKNARKEPDKKP